jgi:probable HAF family extracellular repeat protein
MMKRRIAGRLVLGLLLGAVPFPAEILYSVTDLGALEGPKSSYGTGINNAGQVVGYSYPSTSTYAAYHAFLYSNGQMTDLGTLGGRYSRGDGINNAGQVAGWADTSAGSLHAFLYTDGQMTDLGTLGGPSSSAFAINDAGQIVGGATSTSNPYNPHAFLYTDGQMTDLGTLGGPSSSASGINNTGQIVGGANTSTTYPYYSHAFLYTDGQMRDLGTLGSPPPYFTEFSFASGINNAGQVVGTSNSRAFVYRDGQMLNLNDLIDPALRIRLTRATAINDQGQIVANDYVAGGEDPPQHAYLLTPLLICSRPSRNLAH